VARIEPGTIQLQGDYQMLNSETPLNSKILKEGVMNQKYTRFLPLCIFRAL